MQVEFNEKWFTIFSIYGISMIIYDPNFHCVNMKNLHAFVLLKPSQLVPNDGGGLNTQIKWLAVCGLQEVMNSTDNAFRSILMSNHSIVHCNYLYFGWALNWSKENTYFLIFRKTHSVHFCHFRLEKRITTRNESYVLNKGKPNHQLLLYIVFQVVSSELVSKMNTTFLYFFKTTLVPWK